MTVSMGERVSVKIGSHRHVGVVERVETIYPKTNHAFVSVRVRLDRPMPGCDCGSHSSFATIDVLQDHVEPLCPGV